MSQPTEVEPTGEVHPAAELFPLMPDDEVQALADDIKANGLRQPLVLDPEGRLLDGRNRARACKLAKVQPEYVTANGDDPFALVISLNAMRRDLTKQQRAVIAALAWDQVDKNIRAPGRHREALGKRFGVSGAYVQRAKSLVDDAPEVALAIRDGRVSLDAAWAALEEVAAAQSALEQEEARWEREREDRRKRLQKLTDDLAKVDMLPPPTAEQLEEPTVEELKQATAQTARSNLQEPSAASQTWDTVLRDASALAGRVRKLPKYPADADELLPMTTRAVAKALADAASRLVDAIPTERTMRRVK